MRKDESFKTNNTRDKIIAKNETKIQAQKFKASKTFLGCDTCKLKHNASIKKCGLRQEDEVKIKRNIDINHNDKKRKIKLTDLCEEDKKRIEELMEEVFKYSEKNKSLRESLECVEKAKKDQHESFVNQANIHLEEKNGFLKEVQTYKARLEAYESEMKEKLEKWEHTRRFMDKHIRYLAQNLQKSSSEKSDLMRENNCLKTCLKQSLKLFELLLQRNEVSSLQQLSLKSATATSQITFDNEDKKETMQNEQSEDESFSITTKDTQSCKTDLDIITNKIEQAYSLLRNKTVPDKNKKFFLFKNETSDSKLKVLEKMKSETEGNLHNFTDNINRISVLEEEDTYAKKNNSNNIFLAPFNDYNKTSNPAERIIKKTGKLFNSECNEKLEKDSIKYFMEEDSKDNNKENTDLKEPKGRGFVIENKVDRTMDDEDRLLNDLFYSHAIVDLGLESALLLMNELKFDRSNSNSLK